MNDERKRSKVLKREMFIWELNINEMKRWLVDLDEMGAVWNLAQKRPHPKKREWVILLSSKLEELDLFVVPEVADCLLDIPEG